MSIFHTRPMANKENSLRSTSCLPSFISKPTLSGLGRSPKKKLSSIHGAKPYNRTASVHTKATKNTTKAGKKVPPPLDLTKIRQAPVAIRGEVKIPLSLPKVNIPLVPHLDEFFDADIVCSSRNPSIELMLAIRLCSPQITPSLIWFRYRIGSVQALSHFISSCTSFNTPKYGIRCTPNYGRSRSTPSPVRETSRSITGFMLGNLKER